MQEFTSCKEAISSCLKHRRFAVAHLYNEEKTMDMHIHDSYEIYYSISGGKQFLIDNKVYTIAPGDVFVINQYESHYLSQYDTMVHERIVLSIHPDYLKDISTCNTDLSHCFTHRSTEFSHRLELDKDQKKRFIYYIHKITSASGFGQDLIEHTAFVEMMVMLSALFQKRCKRDIAAANYQYNQQVADILKYINDNISENITIDELARNFYLSDSYICRIFKAETGTTINKYLIARRISIAKSLLASGLTVSEVCEQCGFNDYSNFLKSFTKIVGISPKKYGQYSSS